MNNRSLPCVLVPLLALLVGGCSEERYGLLACSGLVDTLVVYPQVEFLQVTVTGDTTATADHDPGMAGMESVYLGSDGETSSDILVNFDFSDIFSEDYPETLFEESNIRAVKLSLHRLRPYLVGYGSSIGPENIYYLVRALDQPFEPTSYRMWPGDPANGAGPVLNSDFFQENSSNEPMLRLFPETMAAWVRNREKVGLRIEADDGSDGGLVGFASRELIHFSELHNMNFGSPFAPSIIVEFYDYIGDNQFMIIPPVNDTSTFHTVASLPPELAHVQTGLRSYPVLTYDLSTLTSGICVYQMAFRLAASELDPLHQPHRMNLISINPDSGWLSTGLVLEEDLWSQNLLSGSLEHEGSGPGNPVYFSFQDFSGHLYPIPKSLHLMPCYELNDYFKSGIYWAQSTVFGPGADPENRPVLELIAGKRTD